jgi:hypothetical protein
MEMLKQNVKEKNGQIEELSKKNKLLAYQLEEMGKAGREGRDQGGLKGKLEKAEG